jgi:hypothetical protein
LLLCERLFSNRNEGPLIKSNSCHRWVEEDSISKVCVGPLRKWCSLFEINSLRMDGHICQRFWREEFSVGSLPGATFAALGCRHGTPLLSICGQAKAISLSQLCQKLTSEHIQLTIRDCSFVVFTRIPVSLSTHVARFAQSEHLCVILLYFESHFASVSICLNALFFHLEHFRSDVYFAGAVLFHAVYYQWYLVGQTINWEKQKFKVKSIKKTYNCLKGRGLLPPAGSRSMRANLWRSADFLLRLVWLGPSSENDFTDDLI